MLEAVNSGTSWQCPLEASTPKIENEQPEKIDILIVYNHRRHGTVTLWLRTFYQ